jgi:hypothetical protein
LLGSFAGTNIVSGDHNIEIGAGVGTGKGDEHSTIRIGTATEQTQTFIAGISGVGVAGSPVCVNGSDQLGTCPSSARFKEHIRDLGQSSRQIFQLRPVRFRYKTQGSEGPDQYGLIAEEVNEVSPDLVGRGQDGQIDSVRYDKVNILLLSEVQKQHRMIRAQQTTIKAQQAKMEAQQSAMKLQPTHAAGAGGAGCIESKWPSQFSNSHRESNDLGRASVTTNVGGPQCPSTFTSHLGDAQTPSIKARLSASSTVETRRLLQACATAFS